MTLLINLDEINAISRQAEIALGVADTYHASNLTSEFAKQALGVSHIARIQDDSIRSRLSCAAEFQAAEVARRFMEDAIARENLVPGSASAIENAARMAAELNVRGDLADSARSAAVTFSAIAASDAVGDCSRVANEMKRQFGEVMPGYASLMSVVEQHKCALRDVVLSADVMAAIGRDFEQLSAEAKALQPFQELSQAWSDQLYGATLQAERHAVDVRQYAHTEVEWLREYEALANLVENSKGADAVTDISVDTESADEKTCTADIDLSDNEPTTEDPVVSGSDSVDEARRLRVRVGVALFELDRRTVALAARIDHSVIAGVAGWERRILAVAYGWPQFAAEVLAHAYPLILHPVVQCSSGGSLRVGGREAPSVEDELDLVERATALIRVLKRIERTG